MKKTSLRTILSLRQFSQFMLYLHTNSSIEGEVFEKLLESQSDEEIKHLGMTSAQQLMKRGRVEGKLENQIEVVRNAWEEKLSIIQISKITKLSIEKVKELIAQFELERK